MIVYSKCTVGSAYHNACVHSCFPWVSSHDSSIVVFTPYSAFFAQCLTTHCRGPLSNVWPLHTSAGTWSLEMLVGWKVLQNISTQSWVSYSVLSSDGGRLFHLLPIQFVLFWEIWSVIFLILNPNLIVLSRVKKLNQYQDISWNKENCVGLFSPFNPPFKTLFSSL